jgi:hypothetical protein
VKYNKMVDLFFSCTESWILKLFYDTDQEAQHRRHACMLFVVFFVELLSFFLDCLITVFWTSGRN